MYLLDTDTLLHLWQGHQAVKERLLETRDTEIAITAITKSEILRARCDNLLKADDVPQTLLAQQRLTRTEELLLQLSVVPFDKHAARHFSQRITSSDILRSSLPLGR